MTQTASWRERLQQSIGSLPLHPFLFGAHAVLALYAANVNRLPLSETGPLLAGVLLAVGGVVAGVHALCRDWVRTAILTTVLVVAMVYFRPLAELALTIAPLPYVFEAFAAIWVVGTVALLTRLARTSRGLELLNAGLNIMALVMVGLAVSGIARFRLQEVQQVRAGIADATMTMRSGPRAEAEPRRDIYYLIFDRYADAETLRDVYHFDNTPFLDALRTQGFYVAADSASNYQRTAHSLASSLNLDYLDGLTKAVGTQSRSWLPIYSMLRDHAVGRFLKAHGYTFVQLGSWWNPTRDNPLADVNVNWYALPELQRAFLLQTAAGQIGRYLGLSAIDDRAHQCERIRRQFDELPRLARDPKPTFVFAHLLVPHPPYVFGPDGACLGLDTVTGRSRVENYVNQVRYANSRILELVQAISRNSTTEPIIIVQSDEGPWPAPYAGDERFLGGDVTSVDWTRVTRAQLREKMRVLNALRLPGPAGAPLYPEMTPVNTFRIVFNRYFGTSLPLLSDENYVFVNDRQLYAFRRVTALVR